MGNSSKPTLPRRSQSENMQSRPVTILSVGHMVLQAFTSLFKIFQTGSRLLLMAVEDGKIPSEIAT